MKLKGENSDTCENWNLANFWWHTERIRSPFPPFGATETASEQWQQHPFDVTLKCLAFSLRLRFGFCYRVLCYLRLKVLSSDSVGESCVMRGKGMCKLSLWWYYIIIYMYAMYMQCITMQYDMYTMINWLIWLCRSDVRWILMFSK